MLAMMRERLVGQLTELPDLVNLYSRQDARFEDKVMQWLSDSEQALVPFRRPWVARLSSLRGLIAAGRDGYRDPSVGLSGSERKQRRAMTMHWLQEAETLMRKEGEQLDQQLDDYRDKLAQLLAVTSAKQPLEPKKNLSTAYLDSVWKQLGDAQENPTLFHYLSARLGDTDRRYVLQDLLERAMSGVVEG